jgi:hypothetical protein
LLEAFFLEDVENHGSEDDEEVDCFIDTPSTLSSNSKKVYQQTARKRQLFKVYRKGDGYKISTYKVGAQL